MTPAIRTPFDDQDIMNSPKGVRIRGILLHLPFSWHNYTLTLCYMHGLCGRVGLPAGAGSNTYMYACYTNQCNCNSRISRLPPPTGSKCYGGRESGLRFHVSYNECGCAWRMMTPSSQSGWAFRGRLPSFSPLVALVLNRARARALTWAVLHYWDNHAQ